MPKVAMMSTALFHSLGYEVTTQIGYGINGQGGINSRDAIWMLPGDVLVT